MIRLPDILGRRRELLDELRLLDTSAHPLREEQRRIDTLAALADERRGVEARLDQYQRLGDEREQVFDRASPSGWSLGRTGHDLAAEAEARLSDIDDEITRWRQQPA